MWTKRENSSSTPCTPPRNETQVGNLGAGCPQASELEGACSRSKGQAVQCDHRREVLYSGRNRENQDARTCKICPSGNRFSPMRAGPGESRVPGPRGWARAAPAEPTSSQRARALTPPPPPRSALGELPVGGLILLVREEAAQDRPPEIRRGSTGGLVRPVRPAG